MRRAQTARGAAFLIGGATGILALSAAALFLPPVFALDAAGAVAQTLAQATPAPAPAAPAAAEPSPARVPFGPGEKIYYQVSVGILGSTGKGSMEVAAVDTVLGRPAYHLRLDLKGGPSFARVDDTFQSWLDASTLAALRFEQRQKEVRYRRHRVFEFYPEERRWERTDKQQTGTLPTDRPLDDVSFLYYVRTLPLEVGKTYTIPHYFQAAGNPVILRVLRKERVKVPLGSYDTIVVQPIIKTRGLFGEGGEAEVYLSDDLRRIPVLVRSKVKLLGYMNLALRAYVPGEPLAGS